MKEKINQQDFYDDLVKFRRDLHKMPELDFDLPRTTAYLQERLEKLPCKITKIGKASFVAFFDAGKDSSIAFRTDMDALPVEEKTGADFCSEYPGRMHACGHDGHMSIMLGFAYQVAELLDKAPQNVLLVFQAAEETTGGAHEICRSGIFDEYNTKKIFGLHIWPGFPKNMVICRKNDFMAGTKVLWPTVEGKSSHIATPEKGVDALDIGTQFVQAVYKMEKEEIPENVMRILKFGQFNSGTGVNIISSKTEIGGTIRYYDPEILDQVLARMKEIALEFERTQGCTIRIETSEGYPPVNNSPELFKELEKAINSIDQDTIGETVNDNINFYKIEKPFLTSEDFSYYQQYMPGLFFFLGTGMDLPLHNGSYDLNEDVLPTGVEIFKALLMNSKPE